MGTYCRRSIQGERLPAERKNLAAAAPTQNKTRHGWTDIQGYGVIASIGDDGSTTCPRNLMGTPICRCAPIPARGVRPRDGRGVSGNCDKQCDNPTEYSDGHFHTVTFF